MPRRRWHCTCFSECPRIFFISHLSSPLSLDNMHEIMIITFALPATSNTRNVFVRLILNEIFFSLIPPPSLVLFDILFSFENCTWESHRSVWSTSLILTAFAQINFLCVWHAIFENLRNSVRTLWGYSYPNFEPCVNNHFEQCDALYIRSLRVWHVEGLRSHLKRNTVL